MAYSHHERLSGVDAMFLRIDEPNARMQVGAVTTFEAGPLGRPSGGLDFSRIRASVESALPHSSRLRQKLAPVPLLKHPVWVDDHGFDIDYRARQTSLPKPGSIRLLGSRRLESYPLAPLAMTQGLGRALFSYDGGLLWGFNADHDALPDLHPPVLAIRREVAQLGDLAASESASKTAAEA